MDNNIWIRNTFYIAEKNNIKISDIENDCEISTGYLNKLRKSENPAKPNIETVERLAKRLSISIDSFVGIDLSKTNKNDEMIMSFIRKLEKETLENGINWEPIQASDMENVDNTNGSSYPLIEVEDTSGILDPYQEYGRCYEAVFKSKFHPESHVNLHKITYKYKLEPNKYVWLYNVFFDLWNDKLKFENEDNYEMYIVEEDSNEASKVCCGGTSIKKSEYYESLNSLYNSIKLSRNHSIIDEDTKSAINSYLHKDEKFY